MPGALDPDVPLSAGQFSDLMEMFITDMHLRKVAGTFWLECVSLCIGGAGLAGRIDAEVSLAKMEGLSDQAKATLEGAVAISVQEIEDLRRILLQKLALLAQCPNPGDTIH